MLMRDLLFSLDIFRTKGIVLKLPQEGLCCWKYVDHTFKYAYFACMAIMCLSNWCK